MAESYSIEAVLLALYLMKDISHLKGFDMRDRRLWNMICLGVLSFIMADISLGKSVIKIDVDRQISQINPMLYGNFSEHLGQGIYGGIYDPDSKFADEDGFRKDVIAAAQDLRVSILRWPGGNFVSGYHWEDGIGPRSSRPARIDLAWGGVESNMIGTDEFLKYCETIGTEPYICINLGTGSLDEARNWVEYCNVEKGTYYSDLRRKYGPEQPYKVKYWGLGNEVDGPWQMGHKSPEDYAKTAIEMAKLMRWIDKDIKLIASGSSNYEADWNTWNRIILNEMVDYIDYISLHHYSHNFSDYYSYMTSTIEVETYIRIVEQQIKEAKMKAQNPDKPLYIAFDEWNAWTRTFGGKDNTLSEIYDLQDALVVAQYLNVFVRTSDIVKIANMAQLVNVIAPMRIDNDKLWKQTTYFPLQLFANNCRGMALDIYSVSDAFSTDKSKRVQYLDVSGTYEPDKEQLVLNVVNRHKDEHIPADVICQTGNLANTAMIYVVNADDIKDVNSIYEQKVGIKTDRVELSGNTFAYDFEPHSFTQLIIKLDKK